MADPIFGYDVSEHQPGFDHARAYAEGYRFVMARTSEGTYRDKWFKRHKKAIKKTPLIFAAYHRTGTTSTPAKQAATVAAMIGDKSVPVWLDTEDLPNGEGRHQQIADALRARGYRVIGSYIPEWYWGGIGKPKIRLGPLWASRYVDGTGFGSNLYEKVGASDWGGYGGQDVAILQFTESAKIAGQTVDASAFRGTLAELRALFTGKAAGAPAPVPAVHVITTAKGTPLDVEVLKGAGPRYRFRDRLTNTGGTYPGAVCDCIPRHIALVEALAKEAQLPVPLQFWEGSFIVTANSGQTHAGGGAFDININGLTDKQVTALTKIERRAGGAAWLRDWAHGRFTTRHIHVEVIGCSHASQDARDQWADYKAGRDGLAAHGRDYGPKVAYITADQAFNKLTKTASGDWFDMATEKDLEKALDAALARRFGDVIPSPSLNPASVKKNPKWSFASVMYWQTKLVSLIRRDMPTKKQIDELIAAIKEGKQA